MSHGTRMRLGLSSGGPADPNFANVVLLMHGDGADNGTVFTDQTGKVPTRNGTPVTKTATKKFGSASMFFDGVGDFLTFSAQSGFVFGTDDFTIEAWIYASNLTNGYAIYDGRPTSTNGLYPTFFVDGGNKKLSYYTNSVMRIVGTTVFVVDTWYHVAVSRVSGTTKIFVNGVSEGTYTDPNSYIVGASRPIVGALGDFTGSGNINGYMDDLRVTAGVGRYSADFTPPTAAFPNS